LSHLAKPKEAINMQTTYSETFKTDAVKKVLSRVSKTPLSDVAKSLDLPISTLCGWVKAMKNKDLREPLSGKGFVEKNLVSGLLKSVLMLF
jgi:transposase-like protein